MTYIIPLPFVRLKLESVERKGKKLQIFEYLENKKSFLDEINNIFLRFGQSVIWWKNKNLIKLRGGRMRALNSEYKLTKLSLQIGCVSYYLTLKRKSDLIQTNLLFITHYNSINKYHDIIAYHIHIGNKLFVLFPICTWDYYYFKLNLRVVYNAATWNRFYSKI